jgi:hypothetical protein
MEYEIVSINAGQGTFAATIQMNAQVRKMIADGWRPQGGVTLANFFGNDAHLCQAMVKD